MSSTEIRPLFQSTYVSGANTARPTLFPPISPLHGSSRSHSSSTFRLQLFAFGWSFKKSGLGNTGKQRTPQDILVAIRSHKKMRNNKLYIWIFRVVRSTDGCQTRKLNIMMCCVCTSLLSYFVFYNRTHYLLDLWSTKMSSQSFRIEIHLIV